MSAWDSFSRNTVPSRNVYPSAAGPTTGQRAGAQTPETAGGVSGAGAPTASAEKQMTAAGGIAALQYKGPLGQPLAWWVILSAAIVGLMMLAQRMGEESEFGNIRMSIYNIIIISLASIIGIAFFKVLFTRFHVPGLSDLVSAV